ncbi:hypothetical protein [Subdoligranulum variabile]|uniref:hypothetical protein n=1 Tax=Subdoligranulum variabile TaxID=214851 RepID=UPI0026F23602|nr:hypothetical protein [Subdoligranulum variabile]
MSAASLHATTSNYTKFITKNELCQCTCRAEKRLEKCIGAGPCLNSTRKKIVVESKIGGLKIYDTITIRKIFCYNGTMQKNERNTKKQAIIKRHRPNWR